MDRYFGLSAAGTTVRVEIRAGITTFLTMAYILFVNPQILSTAIPIEGIGPQLMCATALAAGIGTLLMGLLARYPFALAPGMGLNAYFAYTVVQTQGIAWEVALGAVFISGLAFLVLSVIGVRELVVNAIPSALKHGIAAGIGLFLAFIGLQNAGLVADHPVTLVTVGELAGRGVQLALLGLTVTAVLLVLKVRGAILIGVALVAGLAIVTGAPVYADATSFAGFEGGIIRAPAWPVDLFAKLDVGGALDLGFLGVVFIFLFVDFFDTAGTLIGLSQRAGFADERGRLERASSAFSCDAVATACGAVLGTSTTTSYIESAAGVEDGGRTGLVAVVVAALFFLSIFFWPLLGAVPAVATAPALIIVGAMMMVSVKSVDWADPAVAIPVFLTVIGMPLTFSIATGIALGLVAWVGIRLLTFRWREVHWLLALVAGLLIARYVWLALR